MQTLLIAFSVAFFVSFYVTFVILIYRRASQATFNSGVLRFNERLERMVKTLEKILGGMDLSGMIKRVESRIVNLIVNTYNAHLKRKLRKLEKKLGDVDFSELVRKVGSRDAVVEHEFVVALSASLDKDAPSIGMVSIGIFDMKQTTHMLLAGLKVNHTDAACLATLHHLALSIDDEGGIKKTFFPSQEELVQLLDHRVNLLQRRVLQQSLGSDDVGVVQRRKI